MPKYIQDPKIHIHHKPPKENEGEEAGEEQQETYSLEVYSSASIPQADLDACFDLVELTSSEAYKQSSVGWSRVRKKKEMKLSDMRYILVRKDLAGNGAEHEEGTGVEGFLSFMVTYEDGLEVIYCYEIHLSPAIRGKGIGAQLMRLYEEAGRKAELKKAMLTVFRQNNISMPFYKKLGYEVDVFSPKPKRLRNGVVKEADYLILSKSLQEDAARRETKSEASRET